MILLFLVIRRVRCFPSVRFIFCRMRLLSSVLRSSVPVRALSLSSPSFTTSSCASMLMSMVSCGMPLARRLTMAKFRRKMSKHGSRKAFKRNSGVHKKNATRSPMRGGIRM